MTSRWRRRPLTQLVLGVGLVLALGACSATPSAKEAGNTPAAEKPSSADGVTITDVAGRTVEFKESPERIALGESRQAFALMFLNPEHPVDKVVAWGSDLQRNSPDIYTRLLDVAPEAADIPELGNMKKGDLNAETLLAHHPDVFVMDTNQYQSAQDAGMVADLEKSDIPFVVIDYRVNPSENTPKSVEIMGQLFGYTENADRFVKEYHSLVDPVLKAGQEVTDRKNTFYWRSPGVSEPGRTYGNVNFGLQIQEAGGKNLGTGLIPGDEGTVATEELIKVQPDAVIASGGQWAELDLNKDSHSSFLNLGYDVDEETARASLAALQKEKGYDELDAFHDGHVYGIYHQFYDSPFNFIAYQAFAHWLGTPGFEDVDVRTLWADFHDEFMPWPAEGNVTIALKAAND